MAFDVSPFSVNSFYGQQAVKNRLDRPPRLRQKKASCNDGTTKCGPLAVSKWPKEFPSRLLGPTVCWRTFYRQSEAFEFATDFAEDVYIFAFESATDPTLNKGQRKYLATSLPVFWHYYRQLPDTRKAHYEIIPEGTPCKLYFDLEFQREYNPCSDGTKMTKIFVKFVCLWLRECFALDVDRSHVLDLDASTSSKFSRHLIFQLPGAVFENNVTAGKFVHFITAILIHYLEKLSNLPRESLSLPEVLSPSRMDMPGMNGGSTRYPSSTKMDEKYVTEVHNSISVAGSSNLLEDMKKDDEICVVLDSLSNEEDVLTSKSTEPWFTQKLQHQGCACSTTCSSKHNLPVSHVSCSESSLSQRKAPNETLSKEKDASSFCNEKSRKLLSLFSEEDLRSLFVRKKDGEQTPFCDLGVYTRNRNFRLYLSTKLNKQNPLIVAKENTFKPASEHETFECDIFYASLVFHSSIPKGTSILCFDGQGGSKSIQRTMKETQPKIKSDAVVKTDNLEGWHCISPYPEVDEFIMSLIASNSHSGSIRHWTYFIHSETLIYDIVGYRWCGNIGRHHKSNNIMYVADLRQGVYYQKCYDPECQANQYRSPECPLPPSVLPGYYFLNDDNDNAEAEAIESEDELLITAVEDVELLQVLDATTLSNPSTNTQNTCMEV